MAKRLRRDAMVCDTNFVGHTAAQPSSTLNIWHAFFGIPVFFGLVSTVSGQGGLPIYTGHGDFNEI